MSKRPATANYSEPVSKTIGDVMTVAEYLELVEAGAFIDSDGMAEPVRDDLVAVPPVNEQTGWPDWIKPSQGIEAIPEDATHVVWYNS